MDAATEHGGRNPVSKHQIQPEYGDEQADAGLPNPSRETKFSGANANREMLYFPCSVDHGQNWQPYPVDTYIHTYTCRRPDRATRVFFFFLFVYLEMSLFPSIFCTIAVFSLTGEYIARSFLPDGVFLPCDHGLDF